MSAVFSAMKPTDSATVKNLHYNLELNIPTVPGKTSPGWAMWYRSRKTWK